MATIDIVTVNRVDDELIDAVGRLVRDVSTSATPPSAAHLRELVDSSCTTMLVARDRSQGGRIVGMLTLAIFRIPTGVRAWIEDVAVDVSARGQGVGETLSRAALRLAAERGSRTVELSSRPSREAANRLYQRIGFQRRETNIYRYTLD